MKRYPRPARRHEQAQQIFMIVSSFVAHECIGFIKEKGIITYGELAEKMGYSARAGVTLHEALGMVAHFCEQNDLPYLNAMVVNAETGEPGDEVVWDSGMSIEEERRKICEFDWFSLQPPSMKAFRVDKAGKI